jgi:undecaprenyl diphosphate synthase
METSTGLPRHVAIIMDGNGRWAEQRGLPRLEGHRAGVRNVRPVISRLNDHGIKYATLYTFSTENWNRPDEEVNGLLDLLRDVIKKETRNMMRDNVTIHHIGSEEGLDTGLVRAIRRAVRVTAGNTGVRLGMAFNYGGRQEILRAVKTLLREKADPAELDEATFERYLDTAGFPDADLVIRTSGEYRTSNFLIWQAAYAEYYFTPVLWPDFGAAEVDRALEAYGQRQRRFGGLGPGSVC